MSEQTSHKPNKLPHIDPSDPRVKRSLATPQLRHTKRTRAKVIAEFRRCGRVDLACAHAGVDRTTHYNWLKRYRDYENEFELAREEVKGLMEDELIRRAYHGTMRPVKVGDQIFMVTEFSDRLLEFWLKSRNRAVFGDVHALTGADGTQLIPPIRLERDEALALFNSAKQQPRDEG